MNTQTAKVNLLGLTQQQLEAFFEQLGEKRFRAGQVMKWIHHFGIDDFDAMSNLGKALREKLKACAEIRGPEVVSQDISSDGTRKWVVRVAAVVAWRPSISPKVGEARCVCRRKPVAPWIAAFAPPGNKVSIAI